MGLAKNNKYNSIRLVVCMLLDNEMRYVYKFDADTNTTQLSTQEAVSLKPGSLVCGEVQNKARNWDDHVNLNPSSTLSSLPQ